jgi:hypothetical protein
MELDFFNAEEIEKNAKATVHTSGKLGFSSGAIDLLDFENKKFIRLARNKGNENDENLYAVMQEDAQGGAFRISKSGEYYYVNTKNLFDGLGIDYKNNTVIYDLVKIEYEGQPLIKMIRRNIKRKNKIIDDANK